MLHSLHTLQVLTEYSLGNHERVHGFCGYAESYCWPFKWSPPKSALNNSAAHAILSYCIRLYVCTSIHTPIVYLLPARLASPASWSNTMVHTTNTTSQTLVSVRTEHRAFRAFMQSRTDTLQLAEHSFCKIPFFRTIHFDDAQYLLTPTQRNAATTSSTYSAQSHGFHIRFVTLRVPIRHHGIFTATYFPIHELPMVSTNS